MLELKGIKKTYNGRTVLNIDRASFESGRIYAVLGPNGAGKTTLLRIIAGVETPDAGEVLYKERSINQADLIGYLPQNPYLFDMPLLENIGLGLSKDSLKREKAYESAEKVGLIGLSGAKASKLSGGEGQRTALASVLTLSRKIYLLDEPTSSIDISLVGNSEKFISEKIIDPEAIVILTTHNPSQALRLARYTVFMNEGRIIEAGETEKVLRCPETAEAKEFMGNWRF